jgi:glycosyltransferase involved in cell wall biosynthesis
VAKLSVLMPVYNEARTLRTIVERVLASPVECDIELVCVDDCSTDHSLEILHELAEHDARIQVIAQPVNLGKGKAIRTAIDHMTGDIAIIQDADLEYDPEEYPRVITPLLDGKADAVYGSRFASSEVRRVLFFWHSLGNRILTMFSNMANDLNLTDMETCYKAVRGDVLKRLRLTSDRFGLEPEITARLAQWGARIYEVPISYHGRTYAEGKNIGWQDGVEALWLIFKFRFLDTKATDETSVVTRQSLGRAHRFREWSLARFGAHLGQRVIEVNAGPGHSTSHLIGRQALLVTDTDPVHVETLRRRFGHLENVDVILHDFDRASIDAEGFDTAILFDGLQRSDEPKSLLANVAAAIQSGGKILIQVPSDPRLFGDTDRAAGHVRRFDKGDVEDLVRASGLELVMLEPFNRLGVLGWRLQNTLGSGSIAPASAKTFDLLVPLAKRMDSAGVGRGLSWLAVARVP